MPALSEEDKKGLSSLLAKAIGVDEGDFSYQVAEILVTLGKGVYYSYHTHHKVNAMAEEIQDELASASGNPAPKSLPAPDMEEVSKLVRRCFGKCPVPVDGWLQVHFQDYNLLVGYLNTFSTKGDDNG